MKRKALIINGGIPPYLLIIISVMTAFTVANLHYNIPVLEDISQELGISQVKTNLITVFTQVGYATGLLFIVPLGDLFDARRIIGINFFILIASLITFSLSSCTESLWFASIFTGLSSVTVQMYIPMVSKYSRQADKARNVGYIISSLIIGVLLGRTIGGLVGAWIGWRMLYIFAAVLMLLCCIVLFLLMPPLESNFTGSYGELLHSILNILKEYPEILGHAFRSSLAFASFNTLWACMAFHLAGPPFFSGSNSVGLLGLCGILTALFVANLGKYLDRYGIYRFNLIGFFIMLIAWIFLWVFGNSYIGLIAGIVIVDIGQQFVGVSNQSASLALDPCASNRINTAYMTIYFIGGSLGTFLAGQSWYRLGWNGIVLVGCILIVIALLTTIMKGRKKQK